MKHSRSGVLAYPDFIKLWTGQTISEFGSRITRDAIPLTAVILLAATPEQMGLLMAISSLPVLFFGLFAGVWVDRHRRRPILLAADIGRILLLLCIPALALFGALTFEILCLIAALVGILSLLYEIAYRSLLPTLIAREHLLEGNSKLATTSSLAEIGGPAVSGLLIQWISAPLAIVFDAISFVFSALSVAMIDTPEPSPTTDEDAGSVWREIVDGFRVIASHPVLRSLALGEVLRAFFGSFIGTLYALYAIRVLGLSPATLGFLVAAGGIGALAGALLAARLPRRLGLGATLTGTLLVSAVINLLIPAAGGPPLLAASLLIISQIIGDAAMMVYEVNEISLRQMLVPQHLLGRANASIGFLSQGIAPIGALVAGALAGLTDARLTLWVAVLGILFTAVGTRLSAARRAETHLAVAGD
jgi:predicted MFS family arabinose efflux permease